MTERCDKEVTIMGGQRGSERFDWEEKVTREGDGRGDGKVNGRKK